MSDYPPLVERLAALPADTKVTDEELAFLKAWQKHNCKRSAGLWLLYGLGGGPLDAEDHAALAPEKQRIAICKHIAQIVDFNLELRTLPRRPEPAASPETVSSEATPLSQDRKSTR